MHRLSALLSWDKRKSAPKPPALDRLSTTSAPPKFKKEAFWPSSLDQECQKAARILKSFCSMALFLFKLRQHSAASSCSQLAGSSLTLLQLMAVSRSPRATNRILQLPDPQRLLTSSSGYRSESSKMLPALLSSRACDQDYG